MNREQSTFIVVGLWVAMGVAGLAVALVVWS